MRVEGGQPKLRWNALLLVCGMEGDFDGLRFRKRAASPRGEVCGRMGGILSRVAAGNIFLSQSSGLGNWSCQSIPGTTCFHALTVKRQAFVQPCRGCDQD